MKKIHIQQEIILWERYVINFANITKVSIQHDHGIDTLLHNVGEWGFIDLSIKDELFIPDWEEVNNES